MSEKSPSPLQSGFLLTQQEKFCILVICALGILGMAARYIYLGNQHPSPILSIAQTDSEPPHE